MNEKRWIKNVPPSGEGTNQRTNESTNQQFKSPTINRQESVSSPIRNIEKVFFLKTIFFIVLASFAAYLVGTSLQGRLFRRERVFEVKLEMLRQGKAKATDLYLEIRGTYLQIKSDERFIKSGGINIWLPDILVLHVLKEKLKEIEKFGESIDGRVGVAEIKTAEKQLNKFIESLQQGKLNPSKDFDLKTVEKIGSAYSNAIIALLKKGK